MFQALSEAAANANLTTLPNIRLGKGESLVENSNKTLELASELEWAGPTTSNLEWNLGRIGKEVLFDLTRELHFVPKLY